jgi:hypothetical protein
MEVRKMPNVISIFQHPNHTDKSAVLVGGPVYRGCDIYKVRRGFVALLGNDQCFDGLFATQHEAEMAQKAYLAPILKGA